MKLNNLLKKSVELFQGERKHTERKYEVITHEENYQGTGHIYVKVRCRRDKNTFYKSAVNLNNENCLNQFSQEDAAFITTLALLEQQKPESLNLNLSKDKQRITPNVVILGMMFVSFLILSNLTAFKIVEYKFNIHFLNLHFPVDVQFPAALVFFPLTYFFSDNLTEVYGFQISRFIIWSGLICNALIMLGIYLTIHLKASYFWGYQKEYAAVFGSTFRIFIASTLGYFIGEFCNAVILSKIKILTAGRWLWLRVVSSTSIAVGIDSIIFCNLAFWGILPNGLIWKIILTQYLFKLTYEILVLPLTYLISGFLKQKDKVNYFDYKTKFNPFSLKIDKS